MLIAYSTAEGESASHVGDGARLYAKVLAEEIVKPAPRRWECSRGAASREGNDQPGTVPRVQCHGTRAFAGP